MWPSLNTHIYNGRSWYTAKEGDIRIATGKKWNTAYGPDLRTVLMHEILHVLGLGDLGYYTKNSIMTTYAGPRVPASGDIAGLKILYG